MWASSVAKFTHKLPSQRPVITAHGPGGDLDEFLSVLVKGANPAIAADHVMGWMTAIKV
jgi:hypothetical protein